MGMSANLANKFITGTRFRNFSLYFIIRQLCTEDPDPKKGRFP
jgi:hypothetical protein